MELTQLRHFVAAAEAESFSAAARIAFVTQPALTRLERGLSGFREVALFADEQALAFPAERAASLPRRVRPSILQGEPLIVRTHCEDTARASRILDRGGVRPTVVARVSSDEVALALVAAGIGACLLPDSFSAPGVVIRRGQGVGLRRRIGLVWRRDLDPVIGEAARARELRLR